VGTPSALLASAEADFLANRRSRFSWAFRVLSISLRRFSNVFAFFAMLVLCGIIEARETGNRIRLIIVNLAESSTSARQMHGMA